MTDPFIFLNDILRVAEKHKITPDDLFEIAIPKMPLCGVYFLFEYNEKLECSEIVYVGKSTNVYTRLGSHATSGRTKNFQHVAVIECAKKDLGAFEYALIATFQPKYNGRLND
jgi:excinuclease UvrABC nuclease subunit